MNIHLFLLRRLLCAVLMAFALARTAHAQWQTQSFTLKPGWNAVYLHVDASHIQLDDLINGVPNNPITEIWLWRQPATQNQFTLSTLQSTLPNSLWTVWDRSPVVTDTVTRLIGNAAYLIRNTNSVDFVWSVTGKPVVPRYQWTTSDLNFIGFPTPANTAPNFQAFLTPVPALSNVLGLSEPNGIYRYPGGDLGANNPARLNSIQLPVTAVRRGEAFWISAGKDFYNRYFGPFEVDLQSSSGVAFSDTLGAYSVRLKNTTATSGVVITLNMVASEAPPSGQTAIVDMPPILVRGSLNTADLTYNYTSLTGPQTFTLQPQGKEGSELEIVFGLNRSAMTGPPGSLFAAVLRFTDSTGLEQVDVPVSATVADTSGLWVGSAVITSVNHYLKTYANKSNPANIPATDPAGYAVDSLPGKTWTIPAGQPGPLNWSAVASSADGTKLTALASSGEIYTSANFGTNWLAQAGAGPLWWYAIASSEDGMKLAAVVHGGQIYTSIDSGVSWAPRETARLWSGIASSADGTKLAAVAAAGGDSIYTSTDSGVTWIARTTPASTPAWSAIASSADGTKLAAVASGGDSAIYTSADSGVTWTARPTPASSPSWSAIASSANGLKLVAAAANGFIYTSSNGGVDWVPRLTDASRNWQSVGSSRDGSRLLAAESGGTIHSSTDSGANWTAQAEPRAWASVATSADGTSFAAVVEGGQIHTSRGTYVSIETDPTSGNIIARSTTSAPYIATGTNTSPGSVARAYPLRLILHNNGAAGSVNLLQRVYLGQRFGTEFVIATRESLLDSTALGEALRISAAHLPFSHANVFWPKTAGGFGSSVSFTVPLDYNDQVSNPFIHTYHPDHDNLKADFKTAEVQGAESYTVTRQITLSFAAPPQDFAGLTSATSSLGGNYAEVITFSGRAGNSRQFTIGGNFILNRISPIANLTTN